MLPLLLDRSLPDRAHCCALCRASAFAAGVCATGFCAARRSLVFEQCVTNDAARVILTWVKLFPVDLIKIRPHFIAKPIFRTLSHSLCTAHEFTELLRIPGQPLWAEQDERNHHDHENLVDGQPHRVILLGGGLRNLRYEPVIP